MRHPATRPGERADERHVPHDFRVFVDLDERVEVRGVRRTEEQPGRFVAGERQLRAAPVSASSRVADV